MSGFWRDLLFLLLVTMPAKAVALAAPGSGRPGGNADPHHDRLLRRGNDAGLRNESGTNWTLVPLSPPDDRDGKVAIDRAHPSGGRISGDATMRRPRVSPP